MPTKKKRAFNKKNSVKFLLLHGNNKAVNADGETLKNVLVPVSKNYKPGSSLLMSRIAELVNESTPPGASSNEVELEEILGQFDDASSTEDDFNNIKKGLKRLKIDESIKNLEFNDFIVEEEFEDDGDFADGFSDFSGSDTDTSETASALSSLRPDCPENLKVLEERFKKKLEEYEDDQLGALDDEDICGYLTGESERVNHFIHGTSKKKEEEEIEIGKCDEFLKEKILQYTEEETDENIIEIVTEKPLEFDCESILSTYSNKYNHPVLIKGERKVRKIKIPDNPLQKQLTKSKLKQLDSESESEEDSDDNFSIASTINTRLKMETPEQRRERKNLFKEAKRESRMFKKENKLAFKNEKKLQIAQAMNVQKNKGIKLL